MDHLIDRLLILLNYDKATLKRLVNNAISRYPNQSAIWYLERVIFEVLQERIASRQRERAKIPIVTSKQATFSKPEPLPIQPTWRLIKHFNGDRKAAERLLESAVAKYPDKPEQWILDKVAWDLWRDRM